MDKMELAKELGYFKEGYSFIDYCLEGAPQSRWICGIISGEKGTYKSNTLLQHGYSMFHGYDSFDQYNRGSITNWEDMDAWNLTLHHVVYRPQNFANIIDEALKEKRPRSWIGWDDIAIHLSTALYSTDREKWEVLSSNWAGFRGLLRVFECTAPSKMDVINFIRSDMNYDIELSGRQIMEVFRWFNRGNLMDPMSVDHYRIDIEKSAVHPERVPPEVWEKYNEMTMSIREEMAAGMRDTLLEMDKPKDAPPKEVKDYPCQCGQVFANASNLRIHQMSKVHKRNMAAKQALEQAAPSVSVS